MRLEIDELGHWWLIAVVLIAMSIVYSALAVTGLFIGSLPFSLIMGLFCLLQAGPAVQAFRFGDSLPGIVVDREGLAIEHPAIFREPVHIRRSQVHSVYLGPLDDDLVQSKLPDLPPGAGFRQRMKHLNASLNRTALRGRHFTSTELAPDLSMCYSDADLNVMIVFETPIPLGSVTRRLGGLRAIGSARGANLTFPSRRTNAHGVFARVNDLDSARQAFASWPLNDEPAAEDLAWVGALRADGAAGSW